MHNRHSKGLGIVILEDNISPWHVSFVCLGLVFTTVFKFLKLDQNKIFNEENII